MFTKFILWDESAASAQQSTIFQDRTVEDVVGPKGNGNARLLTAGSDDRTTTVGTNREYPIRSAAKMETGLEKKTAKLH